MIKLKCAVMKSNLCSIKLILLSLIKTAFCIYVYVAYSYVCSSKKSILNPLEVGCMEINGPKMGCCYEFETKLEDWQSESSVDSYY